jgi:uroporphyrinogen-III synthase
LLTRPAADAMRSAERLAALGHHAVVSPVIEMRASGAAWPSGAFEGMIATSAAAFDLSQFTPEWPSPEVRRMLRIFAVGNKTAEAARQCGFGGRFIVETNAKDLAETILRTVQPPARLLYLAGHDRKADLEARCKSAGLNLTVIEIYEARAADVLSDEALEALGRREIGAVLHYSRRSAEIFLALAAAARIDFKALRHMAISQDTAAPLYSRGCPFVSIALEPNEKALLALLPDSKKDNGELARSNNRR